jgi:hypothetical protein
VKKPGKTLYVVSFQQKPGLSQVVLKTTSKEEAEYMLKDLEEAGEKGRIEEIPPRNRSAT